MGGFFVRFMGGIIGDSWAGRLGEAVPAFRFLGRMGVGMAGGLGYGCPMTLKNLFLLMLSALPLTAAEAAFANPLAAADGTVADRSEVWRGRVRPQTLLHFREQVYGARPVEKPADFRVKVIREDPQALDGAATLKEIEISYSGPGGAGKFHPLLLIPNAAKSPAPTFLLFSFDKPDAAVEQGKFGAWPVREIIARGYATVAFHVSEVDPDRADGFAQGVRALFGKQPPAADAWGALSAWGWAASRVMDYLETDPAIDASRVALIGHSRCGKAALWCGAEDERFSYVISNNSGCGGAALSKTKGGEKIADITTKFPFWFCGNFRKYAGREGELPVDQHQLLGLIAPRLLYVASATQDEWADGKSEFESAVRAGPVFRLLGKTGLESETMPPADQPLTGGHIGYHMRTGKHDLAVIDWRHYMDFADRHWKSTE